MHYWLCWLCMVPLGSPGVDATDIFHIFNDYVPSARSKQLEHAIVWQSWANAKQVAAQHGVQVHHVAVVLRSDRPTVPSAALFTGHALKDPFSAMLYGRPVPTVGGTLSTAFKAMPADALVIFTNRDIGFFPNMYLAAVNASLEPNFVGRSFTRLQVNNTSPRYTRTLKAVLTAPKLEGHHGHDCFVFRTTSVPRCYLDDRLLMLGTPGWDWLLRRLLLESRGNEGFKILHGTNMARQYTFHAGKSDLSWRKYKRGVGNADNVLFVWSNFKHRPGHRMHDSPGIGLGLGICDNEAYTNTYPVCRMCQLARENKLINSTAASFACNGTFFPGCARPDCDITQFECYSNSHHTVACAMQTTSLTLLTVLILGLCCFRRLKFQKL
eukprot:m.3046 g.3046  ORF g.3046 m.3046 type:complete len:382 (-) comp4394_c0_seq2:32-1177(-)